MEKKARKMQLVLDGLALRETPTEDGSKSVRTVSGYAIRFDEDSVKMYDYLTERIARSCVTEDYLRECDIKMTLFHNRESLLARWNKGEGSLRLAVDKRGVKFEFEPADDEFGKFCVEHIERGDLNGCSFTFMPGDYEMERRGEDDVVVTHTRFEGLYEMTIGTDPAYPTTSVAAREMVEGLRAEDEAMKAAEEEARKQREREERDREIYIMKQRML